MITASTDLSRLLNISEGTTEPTESINSVNNEIATLSTSELLRKLLRNRPKKADNLKRTEKVSTGPKTDSFTTKSGRRNRDFLSRANFRAHESRVSHSDNKKRDTTIVEDSSATTLRVDAFEPFSTQLSENLGYLPDERTPENVTMDESATRKPVLQISASEKNNCANHAYLSDNKIIKNRDSNDSNKGVLQNFATNGPSNEISKQQNVCLQTKNYTCPRTDNFSKLCFKSDSYSKLCPKRDGYSKNDSLCPKNDSYTSKLGSKNVPVGYSDLCAKNDSYTPLCSSVLSKFLEETTLLPDNMLDDSTVDFLLAEAERSLCVSSPVSVQNSDSSDIEYVQLQPVRTSTSENDFSVGKSQISREVSVDSGYQTSTTEGTDLKSSKGGNEDKKEEQESKIEENSVMLPTSKFFN